MNNGHTIQSPTAAAIEGIAQNLSAARMLRNDVSVKDVVISVSRVLASAMDVAIHLAVPWPRVPTSDPREVLLTHLANFAVVSPKTRPGERVLVLTFATGPALEVLVPASEIEKLVTVLTESQRPRPEVVPDLPQPVGPVAPSRELTDPEAPL